MELTTNLLQQPWIYMYKGTPHKNKGLAHTLYVHQKSSTVECRYIYTQYKINVHYFTYVLKQYFPINLHHWGHILKLFMEIDIELKHSTKLALLKCNIEQ